MRKKGGFFKKLTAVVVALLMVLSTVVISPIKASAAEVKGYITVSVERFTLGLGYLVEPVKVPFYSGDNGATILTRVLDDYGLEYNYTGSINDTTGEVNSTFYLSQIRDDEAEEAQIPKYITDEIEKNEGEVYGRLDSDWLGEFDYTYMSGWMYSVNNTFPGYGAAQYKPKDGDVMRWQFTVWGYGTDLGESSKWSGNGFCKIADKTKLTKQIAEVNSASNSHKLLANKDIKAAYDNAYEVMQNMTIAQSEVDSAATQLSTAVANFNKETTVTTKVEAVEGFKVSSTTTTKVNLAWNKVNDCTGYEIYRYDTNSGQYVLAKTISSNDTLTYTETGKSCANTYLYKIRAYKTGNKTTYSDYSDIIKATTKPYTPKATVTSSEAGKAVISWTNTSSRNSGYEVYMATSEAGPYSLAQTTTAKTCTQTGLNEGQTYYFKVRAYKTVDGANVYGGYSTVKSVKIASSKIESVEGFKVASTTTSSVKLAWNKVNDCTGYKIYRYDTSSKKYKLIKTISNNNTLTYTNTGRSSANTYLYKIRAYKTGSKTIYSDYSNELKATTKPLTPKVTVKSTKTKKATISWTNTSSRNSGYKVYMATSKNGKYSLVKTTTDKTYTKTGLTKGKTYYFKVRAYKTVDGVNVYSSYSTVKSVKIK